MQQEEHHVVLGEELGHRRQFVGADLLPAGVDLVFLLGLPELIGPAQGIVTSEDGGRQGVELPLQRLAGLGGEGDLEYRVVGPEDLREHSLGETGGQRPRILASLPSQLLALVHRDRHAGVGLDEQMVLRQETGEEHPVPVLVGDLMGETVNGLGATDCVAHVAELTAAGAETVAERSFRGRHGAVRLVPVHR